MKRLAIIGHPIGHSLSPAMYNAVFPAMGIDACYEAWDTPPEGVAAAIERLRGDEMLGMNVTVPHKQAVIPLLDAVSDEARAIGAVNCISKGADGRLTGHNTDEYGFLRSLREAGCKPEGLRVVLLGVGGSARAVGHGLATSGAASITLAGRNPQRVAAAATQLRKTAPSAIDVMAVGWRDESFSSCIAEADLVVNCTPIGMRHTPRETDSPLPKTLLRPNLWVADLVYNPLETVLLKLAREAGAKPIPGLEMLIYQAAASVKHWTGREPPVDIMRKAAQERLA